MNLYDLASICRSKNAGPFTLTIDLMFADRQAYDRTLDSDAFTPETIGPLYRVRPETVLIKPFERLLTIKITLPRRHGSGGRYDRDVYGCQQHFPLGELDV